MELNFGFSLGVGSHCQVLLSPKQEEILPTSLGSTVYLGRKRPHGWRLLETAAEEGKVLPIHVVHVTAGDSVCKSSSQASFHSLILSVMLQLSELHHQS